MDAQPIAVRASVSIWWLLVVHATVRSENLAFGVPTTAGATWVVAPGTALGAAQVIIVRLYSGSLGAGRRSQLGAQAARSSASRCSPAGTCPAALPKVFAAPPSATP